MLAIRLPEDIETRLADLAAKTGRTKTFYAKEAILEYMDYMEDKYLAINRLENAGQRWSLDDLEQDLDPGQLSLMLLPLKSFASSINRLNKRFCATSASALLLLKTPAVLAGHLPMILQAYGVTAFATSV